MVHRLKRHNGFVNDFAFSPDSRYLATAGSDTAIRICQVPSGQEYVVLRGHPAGVRGLAFSPDGTRLASASQDKTARIWDTNRDPRGMRLACETQNGEFTSSLAFGPAGRELLIVRLAGGSHLHPKLSATGVPLMIRFLDLQ
jgi:WD40 repeat protein